MNINKNDWYSDMSSLTREYASVKSVSYKKLLKKHYENMKNEGTVPGNSENKEKAALLEIKSNADSLQNASNALVSKGKFSVFNKVDGEYQKESIDQAVNSFVKEYNSLVNSSVKTENTNVLRKALTMVNTTKAFRKSLERVGISLQSDNTLVVDEEKLKNASAAELKGLFTGGNSYGSKIAKHAAGISTASTSASMYTKDGMFGQISGNNLFNLYF